MTATTTPSAEEAVVSRASAWVLLACGLLGAAASLALGIEKVHLLENPLYVPACSIDESVDCASVMRSPQATTFGIPNPFIGLTAFPALALLAFNVLGGGTLSRGVRWFLQAGTTIAVVFVHYLAYQSLYRIGALCPFCIAIWLATIPAFITVTLVNLRARTPDRQPVGLLAAGPVIATVWLLALTALVLERFWTP